MTARNGEPRASAAATLGERLRRARRAAGLTQEQLADQLGIERGAIRIVEHDVRPPRRERIIAWAYLTGADARWLEAGR